MTAHWFTKRLGDIFEIARGGSPRPIENFITNGADGLNWIKIGDASASGKYIRSTKEKIRPEGLSKTRFVNPGDFLLTNSMSFGRPYIMAIDGCIHDGWLVLKPKRKELIDQDYFYHLLSSDAVYDQFSARASGSTVKNLNTEIVSSIEIRLPPLNEQRRIAAILDRADALRRKRKRAIELLDGLAQSIFLEMFGSSRQGLDCKPIGSVCNVSSGSTPRREDESNFGGDICWVKTTEVRGDVIGETEEKVTEKGAKSARLKIYPRGTVLIAMYGQGTTRGKVGILGVEATTNQACSALVPGPKLNPVFLFHQLKQNYEKLRALGRGGNQPNLNGELVKNFEISIPPLERQSQFVEKIAKVSAQVRLMRVSLAALEATFSSIQHRVFSEES